MEIVNRVEIRTVAFKSTEFKKMAVTRSRSTSGFCKIVINAGAKHSDIEISNHDDNDYEKQVKELVDLLLASLSDPCRLM